ncbi:MAG: putative DNA binding domain-containing protein [bacterium]
MSLPVNINDLLNKNKVESQRIEFKHGWNPSKVYHSICAFANDFDNIGGGYILIGVEENNGVAKRPVCGIPIEQIDKISKSMVGFNNKILPYYMPRTSVEEIDGVHVLVIWVPSGINRPYCIPENVTSKKSADKFYVRSGSNSIVAKGEILDELREMANRVPFDDRGNDNISIEDLSPFLLREYLIKANSKLASKLTIDNIGEVLDQMDLYTGRTEHRLLKNVSAMMFSESIDKIFPYSQVDIVIFNEGKLKNPNSFSEKTFTGSVPQMIKNTLEFIKNNIIKEYIIKPKDSAESIRYFNYPYQALEEAIVNALYHRDYMEREPVEITIEPNKISILSYSGPDRSISMQTIKQGAYMRSRRYRNRKLGDYLKELRLSEGRGTGIPTIQDELLKNGSNKATFETDEDRTYFIIDIPVHEGCESVFKLNEDGEMIVADINDRADDRASDIADDIVKPLDNSKISKINDRADDIADYTADYTANDIADYTANDIADDIVKPLDNSKISKINDRADDIADEHEIQIIKLCINSPMSRREILNNLGLKYHPDNIKRYIQPLIDKGYIQSTTPDKPTSPNNKHYVTAKGKRVIANYE